MDVIRPIYPDIPTRFEIKIRPGPTLSLYSTYPPNFSSLSAIRVYYRILGLNFHRV